MNVLLQRRLTALIACTAAAATYTVGSASWLSSLAHDGEQHSDKHHEKATLKQTSQQNADTGTTSSPCISWINPLVKPRVALLCIHGLGLYSGSYQNFGMRMAARGIAVYAIDVRGFGSWMKSQGHEDIDFKACLNDVKSALVAIRQTNPGMPVFLMGESMGGAIALRAAAMYPDLIDGLISSVPAGQRFQQKKTDLKVAFQFMKGPNKQFNIGSDIVGQATQNEKERKDWENDPLDRMDLSAKELMQFQKFMNENHDVAKDIKDLPVLFVQGTEDRLVKPEGTWDLFNEVASPEKYFLGVPSEHLIFEEGQDKAFKFDSRVAHMAANWIFMMTAKTATPTGNSEQGVASQVANPSLTDGIKALVKGEYTAALPSMESAVEADPQNAEAHYWLGMTYSKLRRAQDARREMVRALALGRGSLHSQQANNYLIASGDTTPEDAANSKTTSTVVAVVTPAVHTLTNGDPAVLAFCASWCDQCQNIDVFFKQAKGMFGDKVRLVKIDVEDHKNDEIIKTFNVGPVPTVVYIDSTGRVTSTSIGRTSFINFAKGISGIIR